MNMGMQTNPMATTNQAGETDADVCSSARSRDTMEVLPEAHGHSSKQHEPPENLQKKKAMEKGRRRSVRFRSDSTSSSLTRDFLSHHVSLSFIVQEGSRLHH